MIPLASLHKRQVLRGMTLALSNARALLREARVLERANSRERAFVLAALSLEELGKVVFLTIASHSDRSLLSRKESRALWKHFITHDVKLRYLLNTSWKQILYIRRRRHRPRSGAEREYVLLAKAYADVYGYLDSIQTSSIADLKLRCLYVDFDARAKAFVAPQRAPRKITRSLIAVAESNVKDSRVLRDTYRRSDPDRLAEDIIVVTFRSEMMQELLQELSDTPRGGQDPRPVRPEAMDARRSAAAAPRGQRKQGVHAPRRAPALPQRLPPNESA